MILHGQTLDGVLDGKVAPPAPEPVALPATTGAATRVDFSSRSCPGRVDRTPDPPIFPSIGVLAREKGGSASRFAPPEPTHPDANALAGGNRARNARPMNQPKTGGETRVLRNTLLLGQHPEFVYISRTLRLRNPLRIAMRKRGSGSVNSPRASPPEER